MVGKAEGKVPFRKHRCRLEDNIKTDLQEIRWEGMDWIHLAHDGGWDLVNVVMNCPAFIKNRIL